MGGLVLFLGVAILAFGLFQHLKGKRILAAPFKKTGELAKNPTSTDPKGAMSTEGKVIAPAQQLLSPCTKQPCLAYEVKVERLWEKVETTQDGTKTVKGSDTLDTLKGGSVFSVDDGSGALQIDVTKGADFDNYKDGFKKELNGRGWASQIQFGELSYDVPVISDSEKYTIGFKATEKYVPAEGSLFVLGKIEGGKIVKPGWRSMMTSSKGRDGLIGSINKKKKFSFIGGGVAAVLSVPLMIFGPSVADSGPSDPNHGFGGSCSMTLTGPVSKCSSMVSDENGETFTWTVTRKDTYALAAMPAKGKKYTLDPQLVVQRDGEELANVEGYGEAAKTSLELEPGTYSVHVKSVGGDVIKGGYSFDLQIDAQNPEPVAAPVVADAAPVSKKDAIKAKLAALKAKKAGKDVAAPVEPAVEAPVAVEDAFAIRDGVASCNLPSNGSCSEYPAHSEPAKKGCELFKGQYAKKACSRHNAVGACVMKSGDVNVIYAGGPMGMTRSTAGMMCPKNMGQLALAPEAEEAPTASPLKVAELQPVPVAEHELDLTAAAIEREEPVAAAELELEISAKNLSTLAVDMNKDCGSMHCERGFLYIFTNLSCDKTARWCQLDLTAMERNSHESFVATLPFTPAAKTRSAFDAATNEAIRAFEDAPKSGRLAPVVMQAEKKQAVVARRVVVAEPLAKKSAPVATRTVAVAPKAQPALVAAPAPAPVKAAPARASSSPAPVMQRASKNMAD